MPHNPKATLVQGAGTAPKAPLCKGSWHGAAVTEGLTVKDNNFFSPVGVAESPQGDRLYACPARGYFSVKKSNQKSLGEDPETPTRRSPPRPETLRIPGAGLDDAYKVFILIRFLQGPK